MYLCPLNLKNNIKMEKEGFKTLSNQEAEMIFGGKLVWVVISKNQGYWKMVF